MEGVHLTRKGTLVLTTLPVAVVMAEALGHLRRGEWLGYVYVGSHRIAACPACQAHASGRLHVDGCSLARTIKDCRDRLLQEVQEFILERGRVVDYMCDCDPGGERFIIESPSGERLCYNVGEALKLVAVDRT